jgi:murein L,D-transpeptidase YcbB/YkuD
LLITDGLLRYVADVAGGKLTPRETDERVVVRRDMRPRDCVAFATVASLDALPGLLERLPPDTLQYRALKDMLARLARFQESGGWKALPDGGVLHPGEHDAAIPALRQRMKAALSESPSRVGIIMTRRSAPRSRNFSANTR